MFSYWTIDCCDYCVFETDNKQLYVHIRVFETLCVNKFSTGHHNIEDNDVKPPPPSSFSTSVFLCLISTFYNIYMCTVTATTRHNV